MNEMRLFYLLLNCFFVVFVFSIPIVSSYYSPVLEPFDQAEENFRTVLKRNFEEKIAEETSHPQEVASFPQEEYDLGQISGVDVDKSGNPVLFHRGTVVWDTGSFNDSNQYQRAEEGPIDEDTIIVLDSKTGQMLASWGGGHFYMPHGITIDQDNNIWLTDVALHQVFKFIPGSETPSLVLGKAFEPGTDNDHFCKPTDVAVSSTGVIFVADGYCNSRIMKFNKDGKFMTKFGAEGWQWKEGGKGSVFAIPHSLALIEEEDTLCIADREHRRVLCINAGLKDESKFGEINSAISGVFVGRIFGIAYANGRLYGVNGAGSSPAQTQGLTLDWKTSQVIDTWKSSRGFISPHDLGVSRDGHTIYISEIGPNRLTKFTCLPKNDLDSSILSSSISFDDENENRYY